MDINTYTIPTSVELAQARPNKTIIIINVSGFSAKLFIGYELYTL